jgi:alginate O-acetyltransferase complex protein AlgJ
MKAIRIIFIFLFLGMIYFPMINNKYHFVGKIMEDIPPPLLYLERINNFPKQYENMYDKVLRVKPWLVNLNTHFKIKVLGLSPNPEKVVVGNDGWLYLGPPNIAEYKGTNLFTHAELIKLKRNLYERAAVSKANGNGVFYLVIFPLKHTIYPEHLPISIRRSNPYTRVDQLVEYFSGDALVHVIDIRKELIANKGERLLFYKTDNHWNDLGGYYGYRAIINEMHKKFPALHRYELNHFVTDTATDLIGGEAQMMNAGDMYHELRYDLNPGPACFAKINTKKIYSSPPDFPYAFDYENRRETLNDQLPDALFIRDSFCDAILPLLAENFNHSVYIFDDWIYGFNREIMETEKADIVACMVIESNLEHLLKQ